MTHQWVEPRFGNVVKTQDANGGFMHYRYDVGGLLTAGWANRDGLTLTLTSTPPADTVVPHVYYVYDVYGSALSVRTEPVAVVSAQFVGRTATGSWVSLPEASTVRRSYEFLDGFGRTVESHTVAPNGTGRLVTQVEFDDVGRVVRQSEPFHDASEPAQVASGLMNGQWVTGTEVNRIPRFTETMYDASGRVESTTLKVIIDEVQTSVPLSEAEYGLDWSVTKSPATQAYTKVTTDALGRTTKQEQFPDSLVGSTPITTNYVYEVLAAGSKVTVIDDDEKATVFTSDLGGRRTELADPNSGVSSYVYNASGQVEQIVSDAGTVHLTYDDLGRMTDRITTDPLSNESSSAQWFYDPAGHKGVLDYEVASTMTPVSTTAFDVTKTYAYNTLHQLIGSTVTLPTTSLLGDLSGESYATTVGYDATGAATTLTHDAIGGLPVQTVTTALDKLGRARTMTVADTADTRTLVTGTTFDMLGRLSARGYGNGVARSYGWDPLWNSLHSATLEWINYSTGQYGMPHGLQYDRDSAGRVTAVLEGYLDPALEVVATAQCYTYDGHNRLETAWLDADFEAPCATEPELATQPTGDDAALAFAVEYAYKPTGQVDSITNLLTAVTSQYAYTDTSSPNALTSVTDGTVTDSFTYDDAGRMLTRTVNSTQTALTWDVSSNLVATSSPTADIVYLYDTGGQRIAQISVGDLDTPVPVEATVYFGATQVSDPDTDTPGTVDATRYFTFGGSTVATATSTAGAAPVWALLFGDIQGSAQVMMELVVHTGETTGFEAASTTHTVTRDAYLPYGAERGDTDLEIDRGWLGQIEDTGTGLAYLNARYYDPAIGRFLSPDPLMDPGDPRTLDPYRYADNNPIVFMDPSGLAPSCSGLTGDAYKMCNDYSKNTYNNMTGKTVVENNIDKAKSGSSSGGKKSSGSGIVSEPVVIGLPGPLNQSFGGALQQGSCTSASSPSCLLWTGGVAHDGLSVPARSASQAGSNLAHYRWGTGGISFSGASASGSLLQSTKPGGTLYTANRVGSNQYFKIGGTALGGAGLVYGAYSATQNSIDRGEETGIVVARAGAEVAAGSAGLLATIGTSALIGTSVGTVVPGVGNVVGFIVGVVVGVAIYATVSYTLNRHIDEQTYG